MANNILDKNYAIEITQSISGSKFTSLIFFDNKKLTLDFFDSIPDLVSDVISWQLLEILETDSGRYVKRLKFSEFDDEKSCVCTIISDDIK